MAPLKKWRTRAFVAFFAVLVLSSFAGAYIEIHDTWNFETHYIYNGNWEDADIIKVRAS